jgi:hypothetical protein
MTIVNKEPIVRLASNLGILTSNTGAQNSTAIEAAFAKMEAAGAGWHITFGEGIYLFDRTIEISRPAKLEGVTGLSHAATTFQFPNAGEDGIRVLPYIPVSRKLTFHNGTGDFQIGEIVTGAHGSGTMYTIIGRTGTTGAGTLAGTMYLTGVTGTFNAGDVLTGSISGHVTTLTTDVAQDYYKIGSGCEVKSLQLVGSGSAGNGVTILAISCFDNVWATTWGGNGFSIVGSTGDHANSNDFALRNCGAGLCQHGFYFDGADANAGTIIGCLATSNRGIGFYDSSFLGNTFVGCEADANVGGSYKCDDPNARTLFLNCYHEGGQPLPDLTNSRAIWFHGLCDQGQVIGGTSFQDGIWSTVYAHAAGAGAYSNNSYVRLGSTTPEGLQVYIAKSHNDMGGAYIAELYDSSLHAFRTYTTSYYNVGEIQSILGTQLGTRWAIPTTRCFTDGIYLGSNAIAQRVMSRTAKPDASDSAYEVWQVGDVVLNSSASAGGAVGWVCTAGGSSGTLTGGYIRTATTNGTATVELSAPSYFGTGFHIGSWLLINGVTGRINAVNSDWGTAGVHTLTMSNSIGAGTGLAITLVAPTFMEFGHISGGAADSTGTPGNATQNTVKGRVAVAAGQAGLTVTNSRVSATNIITAIVQTADATLLRVDSVIPASGSFVIQCNAMATGNVNVAWILEE